MFPSFTGEVVEVTENQRRVVGSISGSFFKGLYGIGYMQNLMLADD